MVYVFIWGKAKNILGFNKICNRMDRVSKKIYKYMKFKALND